MINCSNLIQNNLWNDFYSAIRMSNWPECNTIDDIDSLPDWIVKEILSVHLKYLWTPQEKLGSIHVVDYNQPQVKQFISEIGNNEELNKKFYWKDITVYYNTDIDGGGTLMAPCFIDLIKTVYPGKKFNNLFEWCSGAGMIGFSILAENLCQNLYLGDIYKPALEACEFTKQNLPIQYQNNQISTLHMKNSNDIDPSLKFDLIVGNPPAITQNVFSYKLSNSPRITADDDYQIHRGFFQNIKKNLTSDGTILLDEPCFSGNNDFKKMINDAGLKISRVIYFDNIDFYFLEITHI